MSNMTPKSQNPYTCKKESPCYACMWDKGILDEYLHGAICFRCKKEPRASTPRTYDRKLCTTCQKKDEYDDCLELFN